MKKILLSVLLLTTTCLFAQDIPKFELTKDGVQPIVLVVDSFNAQTIY
jgi:hypothetical protein